MPMKPYPLPGMVLDYLIDKDSSPGSTSRITELGYDAEKPPLGIGIKYVNLRDENDTQAFGPYLVIDEDDILTKYHEPAPDPKGGGFWKNLSEQLKRAQFVLRKSTQMTAPALSPRSPERSHVDPNAWSLAYVH